MIRCLEHREGAKKRLTEGGQPYRRGGAARGRCNVTRGQRKVPGGVKIRTIVARTAGITPLGDLRDFAELAG